MDVAMPEAIQFGAKATNASETNPSVPSTAQPFRFGYFRTAWPPQLWHQNRYKVFRLWGTGTVPIAVLDSCPQEGHLNQYSGQR